MNTIWMTWGEVFNNSLQDLWWGFIQFAPKLIIAIIFFIIGWVLGSIVSKAVEQVFGSLKVDKLLQSLGADNLFRRAGMNLNSGFFVGQLVKWFVIIVFLLPSLSLVGLGEVGDFLRQDVLAFLPRVIVAALVLIVAAVVSEGLSGAVKVGARSMGVSSVNLFGTVAKYAVWVFAFVIALGKLGLEDYMTVLFSGLTYMIALAGALAIGLGSKDAVARFIAKIGDEMSNRS